jgi:hypothetical protein
MSSRVRVLPALCVAICLSIGCGGEPPDKEMQQAQGAIDAARAASADRYAKDEFEAAQLALTNAHKAVADRDYRLALNHALDSRERAQNAAAQAADGMASARVAADRALTQADAAVTTAAAKLDAARASKTALRLLAEPAKAIDTAQSALQEARALFDRGEYLEVPARASAATSGLPAALEAIEKAGAPPPRRRR